MRGKFSISEVSTRESRQIGINVMTSKGSSGWHERLEDIH